MRIVPETANRKDWPRLVAKAINFLLTRDGMGVASTANSTSDLLGSSATFTGNWEANDYDQVGFNVQADVSGTFYLDVSPDGGTTTTKTVEKAVRANDPVFGTLVKGAGCSVRARFVNDATAQTSFVQKVFFGDGLFPHSASDDGEILTTVTERERNVFVDYSLTGISAVTYAILIDKSDTTNFKHDETGRIDLSALYVEIDRDSTATGAVKIGVILDVDGTDANIAYFENVRFDRSDQRRIVVDRNFSPSQIKLGVESGALTRAIVSDTETAVTAVNTGITINGPGGLSITPAVGDVIIKYENGAGTYDAAVSALYHGEVSAT